jgi:hypothetical protein
LFFFSFLFFPAKKPQLGQPFTKSFSSPVKPHLGQRTFSKKHPHLGQRSVLRSTVAPQLSQKKRAATITAYPAVLPDAGQDPLADAGQEAHDGAAEEGLPVEGAVPAEAAGVSAGFGGVFPSGLEEAALLFLSVE